MQTINKEKNFVSAVVYLHNESDRITEFLKTVNSVLSEKFTTYEIICVNDKSSDNTTKLIEEFCETEKVKSLTVLDTSFYQGKENAMVAGVDLAVGDFVFEFESAGIDYDKNLILDIYYKSLEGNDIVFAANDDKQKFTSKLFYSLFNKFSNMQFKIGTQRFSIISRRGINRVKSMGVKTVYRKAVYASCGLKVGEIKYKKTKEINVFNEKREQKQELAINSLILFTDIGYKVSMSLSLIMAFIVLVSGVYTVVAFLFLPVQEGWTTTMLVTSFGFFGLFIILSIITKYLALILNLVFTKKQYTVESIKKITK